MLTQSEENYLKAIYNISLHSKKSANTNIIAEKLNTKASSVTDMIKKLSEKKLVDYQKYKGTSLTTEGKKIAVKIVRKHRLWEVFLVKKLHFNWDEVHDIAEQLEHIDSPELIEKLDSYLNYPTKDPHGDPIPDASGKIRLENGILLSNAKLNVLYKISCVKDNSSTLLQFLDKHSINIDSELTVVDKFDFDGSINVKLCNGNLLTLSKKVCVNVFVNIK